MPESSPVRLDVLVLGGTRFLGRALVESARARGHRLTLLNRGLTAPGLFPDVEHLTADRGRDLSALADRTWDVAIDVAGYDPADVRRSAEALQNSVDQYVFISTVSVYADHNVPQAEDDPVHELGEATATGDRYGARKAAAERIVLAVFPRRAFIVRPGLIVGPHDPTDRFAYWPRRVAAGGEILAPGSPLDPVQFIDVRDLSEWIISGVEQKLVGTYNATGEPIPFNTFLQACQRTVGSDTAELTWVDSDLLRTAGVDPWMGVPLWIGEEGWAAANQVVTSRARSAGLVTRPIGQTISETLRWDSDRGPLPIEDQGLPAAREQEILVATGTLAPLDRPVPDVDADERVTLGAFLDYVREGVIRKLVGLDDDDARRPGVDSGTSLMGLAKHVSTVEVFWLHHAYAGRPEAEIPDDALTDNDTVESVVVASRQVAARTTEILGRGDPTDSRAAIAPFGPPARTLRWVLVHLVEEVARHAGHADILREQIDGRVGR